MRGENNECFCYFKTRQNLIQKTMTIAIAIKAYPKCFNVYLSVLITSYFINQSTTAETVVLAYRERTPSNSLMPVRARDINTLLNRAPFLNRTPSQNVK